MTLSIMTLSIMTLGIKGFLYVTLSIKMLYRYAECRILFKIMLNVIMLSVVMLNDVMLIVAISGSRTTSICFNTQKLLLTLKSV